MELPPSLAPRSDMDQHFKTRCDPAFELYSPALIGQEDRPLSGPLCQLKWGILVQSERGSTRSLIAMTALKNRLSGFGKIAYHYLGMTSRGASKHVSVTVKISRSGPFILTRSVTAT